MQYFARIQTTPSRQSEVDADEQARGHSVISPVQAESLCYNSPTLLT